MAAARFRLRIWITLPPPRGGGKGGALTDHTDLLMPGFLLLVLVLVAALAVVTALRRRSERAYVSELREREERLKLALWATGEHYWSYDLATGKVLRAQPDETVGDSLPRLPDPVEVDQVIHADDLPLVRERLQAYLDGATRMFRSEHRVLDTGGEWVWIRARGRAVERDRDGKVVRMAGPRSTSPPTARSSASA